MRQTCVPVGLVAKGGRCWALAILTGALLVATPPAPVRAQEMPGPRSVAPVAEKLLNAVVNISTTQTLKGPQGIPLPKVPEGSPFEDFFKDFFERKGPGGGQRRVSSLGSGFVIDPDGLIVTNNHVIADADEIEINFSDGRKLKVEEVIGRDTKTDLALLRVKPDAPLPAVSFGDSSTMRVGDWVMAIGNPFGLGGSVTVGIISALKRDINSGPYDDFLQTDAAINKGNSGGPLFNMNGEVIGVNTAIISPTGGSIGIGFAVPSNTVMGIIDQLRNFGEARRGWLGVRIQSVTDEIAESLGITGPDKGALIASVSPDGPAAAAGIEAGDVVLRFDDKPVESMRELPKLVAQAPIGKAVPVEVLRNGERKLIEVMIGRLKEDDAKAKPESDEPEPPMVEGDTLSAYGLVIAVLTTELMEQYGFKEEVSGAIIIDVDPDSEAAKKGFKAGMVITEVTQKTIDSPAAVLARIEEMKELGRSSALFGLLDSTGQLQFKTLPIQ